MVDRKCIECGVSINERYKGAYLCVKCSNLPDKERKKRLAERKKLLPGNCKNCGRELVRTDNEFAKDGYCFDCGVNERVANLATSRVNPRDYPVLMSNECIGCGRELKRYESSICETCIANPKYNFSI